MKAKKKPLDIKTPADFGVDATPQVKTVKVEAPAARKAGIKVADVATLVDKLSITGNRYRMDSNGKAGSVISAFLPDDSATRTSEGVFGGGYPVTQRFTEKRGRGDQRVPQAEPLVPDAAAVGHAGPGFADRHFA